MTRPYIFVKLDAELEAELVELLVCYDLCEIDDISAWRMLTEGAAEPVPKILLIDCNVRHDSESERVNKAPGRSCRAPHYLVSHQNHQFHNGREGPRPPPPTRRKGHVHCPYAFQCFLTGSAENNIAHVKRLVQHVDMRNPDPGPSRYTSLAWAAVCGSEDTFDYLLGAGHDDEELSKVRH